MERYQTMELLKKVYEEIVESRDAKRYLLREEEIDSLFDNLQSMANTPYDSKELTLLNDLSVLNNSLQSLMANGLNRIQKNHEMSPVVSKHYERTTYNESYFFDKKN